MTERSDDERLTRLARLRREPPPLERVTVTGRSEVSPRLLVVTFSGDGVAGLHAASPASSVRLLVPSPGEAELEIPEWDGNEFLLADGTRPILRTFTPLRPGRMSDEARRGDRHPDDLVDLVDLVDVVDLAIVRHSGGAVSSWAETVSLGDTAAISGPGAGYEVPRATSLLVLGDETAIPAITQIVEAAPPQLGLDVHVSCTTDAAVIDIASGDRCRVTWHDDGAAPCASLIDVIRSTAALPEGTHVWAAGEAAAMHAIRTHLGAIGADRSRWTVRGYWKPPR